MAYAPKTLPTVSIYKEGEERNINASDLTAWKKKGWSSKKPMVNLNSLEVKELRVMAEKHEIPGAENLTKDQLVAVLARKE